MIQRSLLIVEDDEDFRSILSTILTRTGYTVQCVADGKTAQHVLGIQAFDAVISDIRVPKMDGIALMEWIKKERSIPVILMTGFSELSETLEAERRGADGFLSKPFTQTELIQLLEELFSKASKQEAEKALTPAQRQAAQSTENDRYCKIAIDDFIAGKEIPYTIFLKLSEGRYVRIGNKGEDISLERIRAYKSKDVRYLYMLQEDFAAYVGLNLKISRALESARGISPEKKRNFLRQTGELIMERAYVVGASREHFEESSEFLKTCVRVLCKYDEMAELLIALNSHSDHLYAHSLAVSIYSVMLCKQMGMHSSPVLYKVSLGGLYHDIGKKEISREILDQPRSRHSQAERALIETHPRRGMEILSEIKGIPEDVAQIAYQHHETMIGDGYPLNLKHSKIHTLARIVGLANAFCELTIRSPHTVPMSAQDAISQLVQIRKSSFDEHCLHALCQVFRYTLSPKSRA